MLDCTSTHAEISLRELLPRAQFYGRDDIRISACTSDSRSCRGDDLFVAICGDEQDGHDFARHAVARGAKAVLSERLLPLSGIPMCVVEDSRRAYGRICQALAGNPSRRVKIIAIAGATGKRATSLLLESVLTSAGIQTALLNSLTCDDGSISEPRSDLTPSSALVASWLSRAEKNRCSHAILELSPRAIGRWITAGIHFDAACVTSVGLERTTGCPRIKSRVLNQLGSRGLAVLNADDLECASYLESSTSPTLSIGMEAEANISATLIERTRSEQTFLLNAGCDTIPVRTSVIGDQHIYSCLAAVAVGLAYSIDLPRIVAAIEKIDHIPGRLERVEMGQHFGVFLDGPSSASELASTISTLRGVTAGRLICATSDLDAESIEHLQSQTDLLFASDNTSHCDRIESAIGSAGRDDCVLILSGDRRSGVGVAQDRQLVRRAIAERASRNDSAQQLYRYLTVSNC